MAVPYADPNPPYTRKCAFDVGDYGAFRSYREHGLHALHLFVRWLLGCIRDSLLFAGLGNCTNSLELGCDCLGNIQYFDAVLNNSKGEQQVNHCGRLSCYSCFSFQPTI
jgi:primary-amine oxidase